MRKSKHLIILLALASVILSFPSFVLADEKDKDSVKAEKQKKPPKTPVTEWLKEEQKILENLDDENKDIFFVIRNKHGVIRSIRVVETDIGAAVTACAEKNADLKEEIETRFGDWQKAIIPILDTADKFLKEEINQQKIIKPKSFRKILKMNDNAFEYRENQIEKIPVTDEKACKKLLRSMDRTENELVKLLQDILLPESVIRQRAQKQEKKS